MLRAGAGLGLTVVLLPATLLAQAATATIEVLATSADRMALPELSVVLSGPGFEATGLTDAQGRVVFHHLRPARYEVQASPPGARSESRTLEVQPGDHTLLRLALGGSREPPAPPPSLQSGRSLDRTSVFSAGPNHGGRPPLDGVERAGDLGRVARPADPWSVLRDVPGVVVDRVNVGGSETGQQSLLVSHGDTGVGATWTLDGIDVTDPAALGFTSVFPDMDAVSYVRVRTGAVDVRVRTPGVQVGLFLREPPERLSGAAFFRGTADALQSGNLTPELRSRTFLRNRTDRILEMGAEAGGPAIRNRLWLWGAVSRDTLRQDTLTEHQEQLRTTSFTGKARLKLAGGTLSLLALRSEKVHEDRDTGFSTAPEARWRQSGPTRVVALEGQRGLGRISLLSRLSYVDAGFSLEPRGGPRANALEDFRGILRGSYQGFETERPQLQAGLEAATRRRFLGLDHDVLLGGDYRRTPVTTRVSWPGNKVLAFERQSVFFRTFRLTGFALPTRDEAARSVHDRLGLYAQDGVRLGRRLAAVVGVRLDRLAGRNLASSVDANPVFPERLPRVDYPGGARRFRWLDLLPRAGISWDVTGEGDLVARATYAAYGAALGAGDVTFDNPIGREYASLSFYWIDRNGDHVVQASELDLQRGLVGASGVNPQDPASTSSPHVIDPGLRSPRTHEVTASLEGAFGSTLSAGVHFSFRRTLHPLWRPLRGLALGDYIARGGVRGRLFGQEYNVGYFAPASESRIVPGAGRILTNRPGYHQDAFNVEAMAEGRIGQRLRWEAWGGFADWREHFDDRTRAIQDPTPLEGEPMQDGGAVAVRPGGLGRGDVFVNARWTAGAAVAARLPGRFEAAARAHAREGFPIPYFEVASTGDPTGGSKNVLIAPHLDSYRLPALVLVDVRVGREFHLPRGALAAQLDVFNVANASTTLQVARDVELPAFDRAREVLRPRLVRLGLAYRF